MDDSYKNKTKYHDYENDTVTMKFNFSNNSLYELGYMLIDINQILVFCDLLEKRESSYALKSYSNTGYLNRHSPVLDSSDKFKIIKASNGSIILEVTAIGMLAIAVLNLIIKFIELRSKTKTNNEIIFKIEAKIPSDVKDIINEAKDNGFDGEMINNLFRKLELKDYDIEQTEKDVYKITEKEKNDQIAKVLNAFVKRMSKTVYKVSKKK